jgi:hypothetical protein
MFIKLRKQLNQQQTSGNVLDSPDANNQNVVTATVADPVVPNTPPATPPVEPPVEPLMVVVPPVVVDPTNPNPENIAPPVDEPKEWYQEAAAQVGIDIDEPIEDSIEGIAKFATKVGEKFSQAAVEREYQEIEARHPQAIEMMRWQAQNPNKDVLEFYAAKLGAPSIDPETLDPNDSNRHKDILYKDFMRRGIPEKMASQYAQNAVDSNSAYEDAKEILKVTAVERQHAQEQQDQADAIAAQQNYDNFVRDIQTREKNVLESGKLGNVIIPAAERQPFADANYYDARDERFPGMSPIDIALVTMSPEEKDLYRYLVWKKLNVSGLVLARETTRTVTGILNKNKGGDASRMSGGSNRIVDTSDRRLDSPGT